MKKIIAVIIAISLFVLGLVMATPAQATKPQYMVVAWTMDKWPSDIWPQTIRAHMATTQPDLDALDSSFDGEKCIGVQVDVYHYDTKENKDKVDYLISNGHLLSPQNPPEPLINGGEGTAWKFYKNDECETAKKVTRYYQVDTYLNPSAKLARKAARYDNDGKLKWGEDRAHYGHSRYQTIKVVGKSDWTKTQWVKAINKATTKPGVLNVSNFKHVGSLKKGKRLTVAWQIHGNWKKNPQTFFARGIA